MKNTVVDIDFASVLFPTITECYELMKRQAMLPNIVAHSEQVSRVAAAIIDHLQDGTRINRAAVVSACLLHDITKTRSLTTRERHDITGARLLTELGFSAIGEIIADHVMIDDFQFTGELLDKEIVCYADKRVKHDQIVSVRERFSDILVRYGNTPERLELIRTNSEKVGQLEAKISRFMTVEIDEAIKNIDPGSPVQELL